MYIKQLSEKQKDKKEKLCLFSQVLFLYATFNKTLIYCVELVFIDFFYIIPLKQKVRTLFSSIVIFLFVMRLH